MQKQPPVYKEKGITGQGFELVRNPLKFAVEQTKILGDFFKVPFFFRKVYVTTNLEAIRHVLQVNQKNYQKSPAYKQLKLALGNGLVTSEGDFWRKQRRMAQPAFYKTQLNELFEKMTGVAEDFCEELEEKRGQKESFDIAPEMMQVTSDIVLKALFSTFREQDKEEMAQTMHFTQEHIMRRTVSPWTIPLGYLNGREKRFKAAMEDFNKTIYNLIDERLNSPNPPTDLLTMLVQTRDEETGLGMNNQQLRDEAITMYSAGHETSANALNWTLMALAKEPKIVAKMRAEIKAVIGDKTPSFNDLRQLQYVRQVIEEGMRLYPPAYALGRESLSEDEILGYKIPKKSIILVSIYALQRDAKYYPNPNKFDPERFSPAEVKKRPKLAYMPFGAGPRMCIGNHFAMMEMQLLLTLMIRRFDFVLDEKYPIEKDALITLKPKEGIRMWVK
jgi:cytochrome P450